MLTVLFLIGGVAQASPSLKNIAPYPEAEKGYERFVIFLEPLENEQNAKIELLIGKEIMTDCNNHWFTGNLEEKTISGWGYNYFTVEKINGPISTLMACPPESYKKDFVTMHGVSLQRYNSKLPIVVYVPKGFSVKYKVWNVNDQVLNAVKN